MKKIMFLWVFLFGIIAFSETISAGEYLTYESIEFEKRNLKLLQDFNAYDYDMLNRKLDGRRFWGWRTVTNVDNEEVRFKRDTLYIIENEGTSAIRKKYYFRTTSQESIQLSATGSIAIDTSGDVRSFKSGLEGEISAGYHVETKSTLEESVEINIEVDPRTRLLVEVYGKGKISNGVGRQYRFFRQVKSGGWEVFTLTSEYYSIVKETLE